MSLIIVAAAPEGAVRIAGGGVVRGWGQNLKLTMILITIRTSPDALLA
jgi:hypothetical protein